MVGSFHMVESFQMESIWWGPCIWWIPAMRYAKERGIREGWVRETKTENPELEDGRED